MKKTLSITLISLSAVLASASHAAVVKPGDALVAVSPPFGNAVALATNQYNAFGLMFGPAPVAVFNDPPLAWGGVNAAGKVDLVSPVEGFFVLPSTSTNAVTGFVSVEIGNAAVGSLTLDVYDISGAFLGSTLNDDGFGPHGRSLATLNIAGIHSFRVSGNDTWGMNQIEFGNLAAAVPEPETYALMLMGLGVIGTLARRQRKA